MPENQKPVEGATQAAQTPQGTNQPASGNRVEVDLSPVMTAISDLKSNFTEQIQKQNKKLRSQRAEIAALKNKAQTPANEPDDADDDDDIDETRPSNGGQQNINPFVGMATMEEIVNDLESDPLYGPLVKDIPGVKNGVKQSIYSGMSSGLDKDTLKAIAISKIHPVAVKMWTEAETRRKAEAAQKPATTPTAPDGSESVVSTTGTAGGGVAPVSGLTPAIDENHVEELKKLGVPATALPKKRRV